MNGKKIAFTSSIIVAAGFALACASGGSSADGITKDTPITKTTSTAAANPNDISGDGMFAVGSQVKAGTYRTVVPEGLWCSYSRLKNASGEVGSILDIQMAKVGEQRIVEIKASDKYFKTDGCGTWTKV